MKIVWRWKEKEVVKVREFNYLGIILTKNGSIKSHLKETLKKANIVEFQVWGIAKRNFKEDFKRRMMTFLDFWTNDVSDSINGMERKC